MSPKIKDVIDEVTKRTFNVIKNVYDYQRESNPKERKVLSEIGSRILFPKYSDHRKSKDIDRISEQELRFIFVEQLILYANENDLDIYYSVETPTGNPYKFSGVENPELSDSGVSARTDLSIHDGQFKRICLIEFKNPKSSGFEKDILKLEQENSDLKYFIQIIKNYDTGTINKLKNMTEKMNSAHIEYRCYCLEKGNQYPFVK